MRGRGLAVIPIRVGPGQVCTRPLDGGPWVELGYADGDSFIFATMDDEYHPDRDALLRPSLTGRSVAMEVKLTRRQMRILLGGVFRPRRPRRRNPLHAVRDRLRRHHRERFHGR